MGTYKNNATGKEYDSINDARKSVINWAYKMWREGYSTNPVLGALVVKPKLSRRGKDLDIGWVMVIESGVNIWHSRINGSAAFMDKEGRLLRRLTSQEREKYLW